MLCDGCVEGRLAGWLHLPCSLYGYRGYLLGPGLALCVMRKLCSVWGG